MGSDILLRIEESDSYLGGGRLDQSIGKGLRNVVLHGFRQGEIIESAGWKRGTRE